MNIVHTRLRFLKEAIYVLLQRNLTIKTICNLRYTDMSLLPRLKYNKQLPEIKNWYTVRKEIPDSSDYLFIDPYNYSPLPSVKEYTSLPMIERPPFEMLSAIKVLQYFCGIPFSFIYKLQLEDIDVKNRTVMIRVNKKAGDTGNCGYFNIKNFDVGCYRVKKDYIDSNYRYRIPSDLFYYIQRWLDYRGFLSGYFLWRQTAIFNFNLPEYKNNSYRRYQKYIFDNYLKQPFNFYDIDSFMTRYDYKKRDTVLNKLANEDLFSIFYNDTLLITDNALSVKECIES